MQCWFLYKEFEPKGQKCPVSQITDLYARRALSTWLKFAVCMHVSKWNSTFSKNSLPSRWPKSVLHVGTNREMLDQLAIGPLQDPITWYRINYTGTQMTQWDFQNKGTVTSPALLSFVLKVSLRHLCPSVIYSVPCDRILQRAYLSLLSIICLLLASVSETAHCSCQ